MDLRGIVSLSCLFFCSVILATSDSSSQKFTKCISKISQTSIPITSILYSPFNSSYSSVLEFSIQNRMFISSTSPKPQFIITPLEESHIRAAVICATKHDLLIRVRSGGHDYEGLSYRSYKPFIIIDLVSFQQITVNVDERYAWVQAGATVGQVYYRIAQNSNALGFPAGVCTTIGVGGHIGGGGLGFLWRKYGLAADNVLDAYLIDVKGKLHDRKSMGEDLFWAIRGAGGASFGVIVAWKIRLVPVPPIVTVFNVAKTLEQGVTSIFYKWQASAPKFHKDLHIRTIVQAVNGGQNKTISIIFQGMFLGTIKKLLPMVKKSFPELGLQAKDCNEMSWISSTQNIAGLSGKPLEALLNRSQTSKSYFKGKSDFVNKAISVTDLETIWKVMMAEDISPMMIIEPMGGKMAEIAESETPFPHRDGNLYNIQYFMPWQDGSDTTRYLESSKRLYDNMTPYVSKSPRASYLNYKDLDLGVNKDIHTSYLEASVWGEKYFKGNFAKLACVKKKVDPKNFFWNEQSIPPYCPK